ncbi:MAG: hypothetical protein FJ090_10370 [Deltaproteobacteria bacterium]|nr:hypothetical protein [Deltaproteobacteria bacterium]MBM4391513.1 hypothetical protein [Deltaproteobacteria bacterium]
MGLRDKIRGVVQKALTGGGGPSSPKPAASAPPAPSVGAPPAPVAAPEAADKPWYLQGTDSEGVEGWDQTNPGAEPGKTNLRD